MDILINKLAVLALCFVLLPFRSNNWITVVAFLAAISISALYTCYKSFPMEALCAIYLLACCSGIEFILFLPVIVYDVAGQKSLYLKVMCLCPFLIHILLSPSTLLFPTGILCLMTVLLYYRTHMASIRQSNYFNLQDVLKEETMYMEQKNRELMEKQDYEVKLAMLNERNRIAREIHDNVGHLLTRSLLQIGALQVIHKNDVVKGELSSIKDTLTDAMNHIRTSVHDLHNESVDLKLQLDNIIKNFDFCHVTLNCDTGELPRDLKYCFISVVREALSNVAKHSDATLVTINLIEHPALWQLIIQDNGTVFMKERKNGIGLINMDERIKAFQGTITTGFRNGFRIFISIPR